MILTDVAATEAAGRAIGAVLRAGDVVTLSGALGAGKTSLARGVLAALGFTGEAPSPSFPLVIAYDPPDTAIPIWHVDLYRLDGAEAAEELGLDDARSDTALLIEWPDRLGDAVWPDTLQLTLTVEPSGARRLTWIVPSSWEARWPPR